MPVSQLDRRAFLLRGTAAGLASTANASPAQSPVDRFIAAQLRQAGIPGAGIGFAQAGQVIFARGYGYADLATNRSVTGATLFHIASITKTVTATAVMKLVESGRMAVDAPINDYLDFPVVNPAHKAVPIRVRHLLMHTSSISEDTYQAVDFRARGADTNLPLDRFLKDLLVPGGRYYSATGCYSAAVPGTVWNYVNTGFALLGYIAGRAAGEDLRIYIDREIFAPLGVLHAAWRLADIAPGSAATPYDDADGRLAPTAPVALPDWPAGMLRASAADFSRFIAMSANRGAASGVRLLRGGTLNQMLAMTSLPGLPNWLTGQGLAWAESPLGGIGRPNHWGGDPGVFTVAYLDPASRSGVVILTNATATRARKDAVQAIAARLLAEGA